jgi:hypothetical protein
MPPTEREIPAMQLPSQTSKRATETSSFSKRMHLAVKQFLSTRRLALECWTSGPRGARPLQIGGCRSLWKMTSQVASKTDEAADTLCGSPCRDDRLVVGWPLPDCGTQYLPHSWWDGDTVCNRCAAKPTRTTGCCYQVNTEWPVWLSEYLFHTKYVVLSCKYAPGTTYCC